MLVMALLIPLTMLGFGQLMLKRPPRGINAVFGNRTPMSMKNGATWAFAHAHCGRLWRRVGLIMLPVSVIAMLPLIGRGADTVGLWGGLLVTLQCAVLVIATIPTAVALKRNFDRDGNPR